MQELSATQIRRAASIFDLAFTPEEADLAGQFVTDALQALRVRRSAFAPDIYDRPALEYRPFSPPGGIAGDPWRIVPELSKESEDIHAENDAYVHRFLFEQLRLLASGRVTPTRLVEDAVRRLEAVNPALNAVVTPLYDQARAAAAALEAEGPQSEAAILWGLPYGAKDLFDTAGIPTTFGAEPYRSRVPREDAAVVTRLRNAGAVLVAKLSLGELAMGDQWYGGRTNNPWNPEAGAGGSSAGSAAAVAAGALPFALGTETSGSIITPAMRCGVVGLRPTFGRVPRTGAMPLSWSFDKVGPITRHPRDAAIVLSALAGHDPGDPESTANVFPTVEDLSILTCSAPRFRLGYVPGWFDTATAKGGKDSAEGPSALKRELMERLSADERFHPVEVRLPDLPYKNLAYLLLADAAAVFEDLTTSNRDDLLSRQDSDAWPNTFRGSHFMSAVEYVQLQRFRRHCLAVTEEIFAHVDMLMAPAYADDGNLLVLTTATGHPSLTFPIGFLNDGMPDSITLFGRPYGEAALVRAAEVVMESFSLNGRIAE
ncbi:MAG: amidase, partial [bacterium]